MSNKYLPPTQTLIKQRLLSDPEATNSEIRDYVAHKQCRRITHNLNGSMIKRIRSELRDGSRTICVIVYGTLLRGFGNYSRILDNESDFKGETTITGFKMFTHHGGYPFIAKTENPEDVVHVEVFMVNEQTFRQCDYLEGYPTHYNREEVDTASGHRGWVYYYPDKNDLDRAMPIESGSWREFKQTVSRF